MTDKRPSWDEYFLEIARVVSTRSPDPNTKNGCVIVRNRQVLATGYNGFISGVNTDEFPMMREPTEEWPRAKYAVFIHDVPNAICQAAKCGISLDGATCYCFNMPCVDCLQLLWQAGIREIVFPKGRTGSESGESSFGLDDPKSKPYYELLFRAMIPNDSLVKEASAMFCGYDDMAQKIRNNKLVIREV